MRTVHFCLLLLAAPDFHSQVDIPLLLLHMRNDWGYVPMWGGCVGLHHASEGTSLLVPLCRVLLLVLAVRAVTAPLRCRLLWASCSMRGCASWRRMSSISYGVEPYAAAAYKLLPWPSLWRPCSVVGCPSPPPVGQGHNLRHHSVHLFSHVLTFGSFYNGCQVTHVVFKAIFCMCI